MGRKRHLFHILPLSPWPIVSALSAFFFVSGLAFYMHKVELGGYIMLFGLMCLSFCVFMWFSDIVDEATFSGFHTKPVRLGLRLGFMLFIASEIMLFFGFFWAFFSRSVMSCCGNRINFSTGWSSYNFCVRISFI